MARACLLLGWAAHVPLAARAAGGESTNALLVLRPAHAEIPLTFWEHYGWLVTIAGLALVALAGVTTWLLLRPGPPVVIPPEELARRALSALPADAADGLTLSRVSQILRQYVRQTFKFPPGEPTTSAFCQMVLKHPVIGAELADSLARFFRENDLRKFSPVSLAPPAVSPVAQALALIDQCEARRAGLRAALASTTPRHHRPA